MALTPHNFDNLAERRSRHNRRITLERNLLRDAEEEMDALAQRWADRPEGWLADYALWDAVAKAKIADTFNKSLLGVQPKPGDGR